MTYAYDCDHFMQTDAQLNIPHYAWIIWSCLLLSCCIIQISSLCESERKTKRKLDELYTAFQYKSIYEWVYILLVRVAAALIKWMFNVPCLSPDPYSLSICTCSRVTLWRNTVKQENDHIRITTCWDSSAERVSMVWTEAAAALCFVQWHKCADSET